MRQKREQAAGREPDLIPVMNLVCLLIPFLLITAAFVQYAAIDVKAPRFVPADPGQDDPGLTLTVLVTDLGFTLTSRGSAPEDPVIPMRRQGTELDYDYDALTLRLRQLKQDNPGESRIRIGAERNIALDTVVKVLDASRGDERGELFPDVTLLAGVI